MPRRLYLARHGETEWNALGKLQGHTDIPLNERGKQQARELAAGVRGAGIGSVITSDLLRSHQTGTIVAEVLGLAAPRVLPELRERKFGIFEGLTRDECVARYPDAWHAWHSRRVAPEGAEALDAAAARMGAVLGELIAESEEPALIISHGGVMRLWLLEVVGDRLPPLHNGIMYAVEHDGARFSARLRR